MQPIGFLIASCPFLYGIDLSHGAARASAAAQKLTATALLSRYDGCHEQKGAIRGREYVLHLKQDNVRSSPLAAYRKD